MKAERERKEKVLLDRRCVALRRRGEVRERVQA